MTHHPIHPSAYVPSETEHKLAYYEFMLNRICWDYLFSISIYRYGDTICQGATKDPAREEMLFSSLTKKLFNRILESADDKEPWERLYDYDQFKSEMVAELANYHCGDCVAVPVTCARCYAEDLYKLPSTVTWSGKHEGSALYHEWLRATKEKDNG